jgi:hypothetical protein|tara:strand:+ start:267 stop:1121 length:855 start_codon:yes stop_codon:yes gene_type:complete
MAKKTKKTTTVEEEVEEGTREAGEKAPKDDAELFAQQGLDEHGRSQEIEGDDSRVGDTELPVAKPKPGEKEQEPEMVEVAISGDLYSMTREAAEALAADQAANRSEEDIPPLKDEREEGGEKRKETDYTELIFTDPNEALRLHGEEIAESVRKEMTQAYTQDQARQIFWDDLYTDYPELKEEDHIVKMVMESNWETLKGLKGATVRKKLAELTQEEIIRLANKQKGIGGKSGATSTKLEGDTQPAPAPASEEDAETEAIPPTLNAAIKERNRLRREGPKQKQAS